MRLLLYRTTYTGQGRFLPLPIPDKPISITFLVTSVACSRLGKTLTSSYTAFSSLNARTGIEIKRTARHENILKIAR